MLWLSRRTLGVSFGTKMANIWASSGGDGRSRGIVIRENVEGDNGGGTVTQTRTTDVGLQVGTQEAVSDSGGLGDVHMEVIHNLLYLG